MGTFINAIWNNDHVEIKVDQANVVTDLFTDGSTEIMYTKKNNKVEYITITLNDIIRIKNEPITIEYLYGLNPTKFKQLIQCTFQPKYQLIDANIIKRNQLIEIANLELKLLNERLKTNYPEWEYEDKDEDIIIDTTTLHKMYRDDSATIMNTIYHLNSDLKRNGSYLKNIMYLNPDRKDTHYKPLDMSSFSRKQTKDYTKQKYYIVYQVQNLNRDCFYFGVRECSSACLVPNKFCAYQQDINKVITLPRFKWGWEATVEDVMDGDKEAEPYYKKFKENGIDRYAVRCIHGYFSWDDAVKARERLLENVKKYADRINFEVYNFFDPNMYNYDLDKPLKSELGMMGDEIREKRIKERIEQKKKEENDRRSKSQQNNKNAVKGIAIQHKLTGEIFGFKSKGECVEFLKISKPTFSQFLKGKSKLNNQYIVLGSE